MDAEAARIIAELSLRLEALERQLADPRQPRGGETLGDYQARLAVESAVQRVNQADAERRAANHPAVDPLLATGARNLDTILANLRRLDDDADATATPGTPGSGGLGGGWIGQTPGQKLETIRAVLCSVLAALNGASINCEGGNVVLTLPDLPSDPCAEL